MGADTHFLLAVGLGMASAPLCALLERLLRPRPGLRRPAKAWAAHTGLVLAFYGLLVLLTARPWCSLAATLGVMTTLVLVNNAKVRSLREPFVAQDYEYFIDTIRHPRLFLPFLGMKNFFQAAAVFVLALAGFLYEPMPPDRFRWGGQGGGLALLLCAAGLCLGFAWRRSPRPSFQPHRDLRRMGLLAGIWTYALSMRSMPHGGLSPFASEIQRASPQPCPPAVLPHLLAVQSESFFDVRRLYDGIRRDVLRHFDNLCEESVRHGPLRVPAWGANTVRTEFAFLSGMPREALGAHRFNPYNMVANGFPLPSLPLFLKSLGYATVCVHPYPAHFYRRKKVFQRWGFDRFLDIQHFAGARRFGPYITDMEVAKVMVQELRRTHTPVFIYAITMENHGPLHLERVREKDMTALYRTPPPEHCRDLTVYLRHLRHADVMLGKLHKTLEQCAAPASLCWFGDHVPIMPGAYAALNGVPEDTDYVIWNNKRGFSSLAKEIQTHGRTWAHSPQDTHTLSSLWMKTVGLMP